jgi:hypothetical protein
VAYRLADVERWIQERTRCSPDSSQDDAVRTPGGAAGTPGDTP